MEKTSRHVEKSASQLLTVEPVARATGPTTYIPPISHYPTNLKQWDGGTSNGWRWWDSVLGGGPTRPMTLLTSGMSEIPRVDTDPRSVSWFDRYNRRQRKIEERERRRNAAAAEAAAAAKAAAAVAAAKVRRSTVHDLLNLEPIQDRRIKRTRHDEREVEVDEEDITVIPKPRKIEVKDLVQVATPPDDAALSVGCMYDRAMKA